jgi:hypothetical protein
MNAQNLETTPPYKPVVVVTSCARPEVLEGIAFTSQLIVSRSSGRFGPGCAQQPARETCQRKATPSAMLDFGTASPSAPSLSGFPGTGAILF